MMDWIRETAVVVHVENKTTIHKDKREVNYAELKIAIQDQENDDLEITKANKAYGFPDNKKKICEN